MNFDKRNISTNELLELLREIDGRMQTYIKKPRLYACGGTLMMLKGLRDTSKDLDFLLSSEDNLAFSGVMRLTEMQKDVRIDLFPDGRLLSYRFERYWEGATRLSCGARRYEVFGVDRPTFLVMKLVAGRAHDLQDLHAYCPPGTVRREYALRRYADIVPEPAHKEGLDRNFFTNLDVFCPKMGA